MARLSPISASAWGGGTTLWFLLAYEQMLSRQLSSTHPTPLPLSSPLARHETSARNWHAALVVPATAKSCSHVTNSVSLNRKLTALTPTPNAVSSPSAPRFIAVLFAGTS
eukprot:2121718-Rhodomonas_salina.3